MTDDMEFEFDIVVSLPKGAPDEAIILDSLFDAGCDDAVVGLGNAGLVGLGFTRSGADAESVILETVKQVLSAFPEGAKLREVKPDLVSLADVAARLQVSRQALQKRDMPPPSLGGLLPLDLVPAEVPVDLAVHPVHLVGEFGDLLPVRLGDGDGPHGQLVQAGFALGPVVDGPVRCPRLLLGSAGLVRGDAAGHGARHGSDRRRGDEVRHRGVAHRTRHPSC